MRPVDQGDPPKKRVFTKPAGRGPGGGWRELAGQGPGTPHIYLCYFTTRKAPTSNRGDRHQECHRGTKEALQCPRLPLTAATAAGKFPVGTDGHVSPCHGRVAFGLGLSAEAWRSPWLQVPTATKCRAVTAPRDLYPLDASSWENWPISPSPSAWGRDLHDRLPDPPSLPRCPCFSGSSPEHTTCTHGPVSASAFGVQTEDTARRAITGRGAHGRLVKGGCSAGKRRNKPSQGISAGFRGAVSQGPVPSGVPSARASACTPENPGLSQAAQGTADLASAGTLATVPGPSCFHYSSCTILVYTSCKDTCPLAMTGHVQVHMHTRVSVFIRYLLDV